MTLRLHIALAVAILVLQLMPWARGDELVDGPLRVEIPLTVRQELALVQQSWPKQATVQIDVTQMRTARRFKARLLPTDFP